MARILVSGLINIETTLRVDGFPINYNPVRYPFFGVNSSVSGVGYNLAKALTVLGDDVSFLSIIGRDLAAQQVRAALTADNIADNYVLSTIAETPQSVILYDSEGRRAINVDLKDVQERPYSAARFERAMANCELLALCNINFSRALLYRAQQADKLIATDVHNIADLDDNYNRDFMQMADILFMSDESLPVAPREWAREVLERYAPKILVIGLGAEGALLAVSADDFIDRVPAAHTRPIVNTIGAGDALFSAFVHCYLRSRDPYEAIRKAIIFASYKIGATSAADGFLDNQGLERLYAEEKKATNCAN